MRKYECVMVLHPGTSEADSETILDRFRSHGHRARREKCTLHDHWGRRELAYPIEKQTNGDYHFMQFTADGDFVAKADRDLRLDDHVLRHLIVRDEEWAEQNRAHQAKLELDRKSEEG